MNILFITADQWRGECLSFRDHPHVKTPNLDALAADGVAFVKHYAQATPCGPSRACLYTGMYLQNHRSLLNGTPLDARHTNVALEARKAGYEPALFGYTDVSLDPRLFDDQGFVPSGYEGVLPGMKPVANLDTEAAMWLAELQRKGYDVPDHGAEMLKPEPVSAASNAKGKTFAPAKFKAEDSSAAFLVDEAIKYTDSHRAEPWFAHLSFLSPHPPFIAPEPFNSMYDANDMPLPVRRSSPHIEAEQHLWLAHYLFNQRGDGYTAGTKSKDNLALPDQELRQIKATYFGMMSEVDAQIGRLLAHLKSEESYDDTMIIFTSDHGELLGDHWMLSKFCYFEQVFHIPLIIRLPGNSADKTRGTNVESFSEAVDVMPTILDRINVAIPRQCDGRSLLPLCHGKTPENWRQEYHAEFDIRSPYADETERPMGLEIEECMVNIICGKRFKYVHFSGLPPLFFDLENDPDEFVNLFGNPAYSIQILSYAGKLLSWRMAHDDPALVHLQLDDDGSVREIG